MPFHCFCPTSALSSWVSHGQFRRFASGLCVGCMFRCLWMLTRTDTDLDFLDTSLGSLRSLCSRATGVEGHYHCNSAVNRTSSNVSFYISPSGSISVAIEDCIRKDNTNFKAGWAQEKPLKYCEFSPLA